MWRNLCRGSSLKKLKNAPSTDSNSFLPSSTAIKIVRNSIFTEKLGGTHVNSRFYELGFGRIDHQLVPRNDKILLGGGFSFLNSSNVFGFQRDFRGFATAAEAISSSTEAEEESSSDEVHELLEDVKKEVNVRDNNRPKKPKLRYGISESKMHELRKRQVKIETEAWQNAAKEYEELLTDMCNQNLAPTLPFIKSLFLGWFEPMKTAIEAEQALCRDVKYKGNHSSHFGLLPADKMAVITMHKLMGLLMTGDGGGCRVIAAASQIGEAVEHEARIHRFLEKSKSKPAEKKKPAEEKIPEAPKEPDPAREQDLLRRKVNLLMKYHKVKRVRAIVKQQDEGKPWGQENQVKVGSRLIQLLIETAYIQPAADQIDDGAPDIRPAFMHTLKVVETPKGSRRYGVIECDPLVHKGLERSPRHMVIPYMPMLLPPVSWTGYNKGAHLYLPSTIMRVHGSKHQREALKQAPKGQLQPVYRALNTLGNTKWRINKRVLDVVDRIWASGGRLADLVDLDDIPLPEKPDTDDALELKNWKWKVKSVRKANKEMHSQRCDVELKLAVARKLKDEDGFFYPHNLDFRGRAYPMHPHLNHLGSDLCRGVLEFGEGRPLGKSGLRWLKIQLANVYAGGVDKLSYEGRQAFADKHVEDIFDSADRPLEGKRWWLRAEDPFQCLATCMSLTEALRSPSPETIISHLPIHQDGSCNGLQHYAALGRDKLGAVAVNLVGGEKPADVYSGIAARVLVIMQRDAEKDPATNPNALHARLLLDQVDRKLVKQTVMTSVYGVTYIGARDQIKRRLKERSAIENDDELFAAASYAAKITLTALEEMFEAARSIMNWLGDCAKIIATVNQPVRWTTPLGLPVVQPYRQVGRHLVKTSLQILTLQRETEKIMVKRQKTAFPPNFVHSLDGSHMMMTANACNEAGLYFAGVHDSYWTHACDVDQMNKILREKFVELYEAPILENLLQHFQDSFPDLTFPPLPERGDFDLKEVIASPYFFN